MAWLDSDDFRSIYVTDSATEVKTVQIEQCLDEAIDLLAGLAGSAIVSEIEAANDYSVRKTKSFRRAQGKLAYRELLLIQSSRYRSGGVVTTERDENNSVTNSYEKFSEVEQRRATLYREAVEAVEPYLLPAEAAEINNGLDSLPNYSFSLKKKLVW